MSELESQLSAVEFGEWVLFAADEPFGDLRADLRAGIVASVIATTMGGRRNAKPTDYMPFLQRAERAAAVAAPDPRAANRALADQVNAAFLSATTRLRKHVVTRKPQAPKG